MDMKQIFCLKTLLAVVLLLTSCGKNGGGDDPDDYPDDYPDDDVWVYDPVQYSLKITPPIPFTEADVARPLTIDVFHGYLSGKLQLQNTEGLFSGTLEVYAGMPSDFLVDGYLIVPCAAVVNPNVDTVSLDSLKVKCGHEYRIMFQYDNPDTVYISDSKCYYEFLMSPLQHSLKVNDKDYAMSKDGKLWFAMEPYEPLVTNFYEVSAYDATSGVHTVDRSGFVDLGISNTLWADKNIGATNYNDYGSYSAWDKCASLVSAPVELPRGGDDEQSDIKQLYDKCHWVWGKMDTVSGYYVFGRGGSDIERDPYIFLPAAGRMVAGEVKTDGALGNYWTVTMNTAASNSSYGLTFDEDGVNPLAIDARDAEFALRPIRRTNYGGTSGGGSQGGDDQKAGYVPPYFPYKAYDIGKVVAWYGHLYYYAKENSYRFVALYLFDDGTFVSAVNSRSAYTGTTTSEVDLTGTYEITSASDSIDYANMTATATIAQMQNTTTHLSVTGGVCEIYGVNETFYLEPMDYLPR
jgi:hypothetical protein